MQTILGGIVVIALIYWAQGDGTLISWIALAFGLVFGIPLLIGIIRQIGRADDARITREAHRAESAARTAEVRPRVMAHVAAWRRRAEAALAVAKAALAEESRTARAEALEYLVYRVSEFLKVDDPDPAFLPRIKLGWCDLDIRETVSGEWDTTYSYRLVVRSEHYLADDVLLDAPLDSDPELIWQAAFERYFTRPGGGEEPVDRVARELGLLAPRPGGTPG
jgi:hypothetical protein